MKASRPPPSTPRSHDTASSNTASFSTLKLRPELLDNLNSLSYKTATPIQAVSLPPILEGKDVVAQSKTGSGKTAAFGLGILNQLNVKHYRVQALVLCPTRELADQVAKEIRKLARTIHNIKVLTLCGGTPFGPQIGSLEHGAHIVVGTPGRVEEHLRKGNLSLEHMTSFILDEADRMLEMGFQKALEAIGRHTPKNKQTLLFSATFPPTIQPIIEAMMASPIRVKVESLHEESTIQQDFYKIADQTQRRLAIKLLLLHHRPVSTVIFCNTKRECQELADELKTHGISALALHGDLEQRTRDKTLVQFASKSISVLTATDVAARGLDIDFLDAVINYALPRDHEVYIHRIGRTGRAGNQGRAFSLYSANEETKLASLAAFINQDICTKSLPPLSTLDNAPPKPEMVCLEIDGGKKQKLRAGDILGALTGKMGISGSDVGKIQIFDNSAFVAIKQAATKTALKKISEGKLKGRSFRVRRVRV